MDALGLKRYPSMVICATPGINRTVENDRVPDDKLTLTTMDAQLATPAQFMFDPETFIKVFFVGPNVSYAVLKDPGAEFRPVFVDCQYSGNCFRVHLGDYIEEIEAMEDKSNPTYSYNFGMMLHANRSLSVTVDGEEEKRPSFDVYFVNEGYESLMSGLAEYHQYMGEPIRNLREGQAAIYTLSTQVMI